MVEGDRFPKTGSDSHDLELFGLMPHREGPGNELDPDPGVVDDPQHPI